MWQAAAKPKNQRPPLAVFYYDCPPVLFPHPCLSQGRGSVRGEPLPVSPLAFSHPPAGDHFCTAKVPHQQKETSFWMSLFCWCERWDLNPHDLTDTSTSSLPVCRFQHARERNLRYYNKMPLFVKRLPEKLPESFASRLHRHKYLRNPRLWAKEKTLEALWLQGFSCWYE